MKADALADVCALWARDFPDVPWLDAPLRLPVPGLRGPLVLQFVFDGGTGAFAITPVAQSAPGAAPADLPPSAYALSLAPDGAGIVLRVEEGPPLDHVRLEQAAGVPTPARVACLRQHAQAGEWEVIHNTLDRHKALLAAIGRCLDGRKLPWREDLLEFLRHLLAGRNDKAVAVYEASTGLRRQRDGLQRLCERFELQLNAHGMKRTFRFWRHAQKVAYLEGTRALMQSLRASGGQVCLGFGAVLGLVRDQDLVGHDDDLDILVAFDAARVADLGQALQAAESCLQAAGHRVLGRFFSHLWVATPEGGRADVFVGLAEVDGSVSFYPSARRGLRQAEVFPPVPASLCGVELDVPADCEAYLAATYGAGWRRPDIGFAHPWDRQAYADIAGVRAQPPMWTRGELARR